MDKQTVISTLLAHQTELQELGIDHLTLFGSVARDEASTDSDVDLLASFNKKLDESADKPAYNLMIEIPLSEYISNNLFRSAGS